jgi:hypothetical protein
MQTTPDKREQIKNLCIARRAQQQTVHQQANRQFHLANQQAHRMAYRPMGPRSQQLTRLVGHDARCNLEPRPKGA